MKALYLASTSPQRASILSQLGLSFQIIKPSYEEIDYPSGSLSSISKAVQKNALRKAMTVAAGFDQGLVISGDTAVVTANELAFGKPKTPHSAMIMLRQLVGTWHRVLSSVAVVNSATKKRKVRLASTKVWFRNANETMLKTYIKTGEPLDKAGGYAIQGQGCYFVKRVTGSYTAVVGFPIEIVVELLEDFDFDIRSHW